MRLLFTSTPMVGHYYPMLPLIMAAVAEGHEVAVSTGLEVGEALGAVSVTHTYGPTQAYEDEILALACELMAAELGSPNRWAAAMKAPRVDIWPPSLQVAGAVPSHHRLPIRPDQPKSEDLPDPEIPPLPYERSIYATFGTVFASPEHFGTLLTAVRDLPVNVIMTTGSGIDPAVLGPVPDHVVVLRFVPQQLIMARSVAVVSHAGSGTVLGAIAARLPQVCLPIGADQHINAAQVAAVGAGIAVSPRERTPERIRAAIERVLAEPSYAAAAGRLHDEIQTMPAASEVLGRLIARAEGQRGA